MCTMRHLIFVYAKYADTITQNHTHEYTCTHARTHTPASISCFMICTLPFSKQTARQGQLVSMEPAPWYHSKADKRMAPVTLAKQTTDKLVCMDKDFSIAQITTVCKIGYMSEFMHAAAYNCSLTSPPTYVNSDWYRYLNISGKNPTIPHSLLPPTLLYKTRSRR